MPRSYTVLTLKTLFMLAGHYCAFPGCTNRTFEVPNASAPVILGEIAHIRASADAGPRADSTLTNQERDGYENLLVLCAYHHGLVDKLDSEYVVADLVAWKAAAELATSDRLSAGNSGVTFLELELVCEAFADGVVGVASTVMVAVAPAEKMSANQLSARITTFMVTGLAHAPMVADYVRRQAQINPSFPERLRAGFVREYERLRSGGLRGDDLFLELLAFGTNAVLTPQSSTDQIFTLRTAALAVQCHLFQICDVFEAPQ